MKVITFPLGLAVAGRGGGGIVGGALPEVLGRMLGLEGREGPDDGSLS